MTKVLIIEADFYPHIANLLRSGAKSFLEEAGVEYDILSVPGALELPSALAFVLQKDPTPYDAFIVLGCVIRGETSHYDIVCGESARGVYDLVLKHYLALGNGILTVENEEQALDRADPAKKNKGGDAARAALHMLSLKKKYIT
ncbi:MAG: 6,7-dimethyl-8-ribityllumazine synthase [Alphaproteobacteria bacterium]|nr:6,7-dimethyl-8-ribityllumazine synthase [Alphaproteobacteria bacterium]